MTTRAMRFVLAAAASVPTCGAALADGVSLVSDRDNTLIEDATGAVSNGAGQQVFAGRILFGSLRRAVLRFNVAGALPPGSTVTAASLTLSMSQTTSGDKVMTLYRLTADWGEGTSMGSGSGADSTPNDATWIHTFFPDQLWANPGGDFDGHAIASQTVGGIGAYTWTSTALAGNVQAGLDTPAANFGWILIGDEDGGTGAKRFESRQSLVPANRPLLQIIYTPPPPSCPADRDHNGAIEPADVANFISDWFTSLTGGTLAGDFDGNGVVDPSDVAAFVNTWFAALATGQC